MSSGVTLAEAASVLDVPREGLVRLCELVPALAPDAAGLLSVRALFALQLLSSLPFCEAGAAITIATAAAEQADADGHRLLAVALKDGVLCLGWVRTVEADLARVVLVLPIDRMLRDLSARLAHGEAGRDRAARLH